MTALNKSLDHGNGLQCPGKDIEEVGNPGNS